MFRKLPIIGQLIRAVERADEEEQEIRQSLEDRAARTDQFEQHVCRKLPTLDVINQRLANIEAELRFQFWLKIVSTIALLLVILAVAKCGDRPYRSW